MYLVLSAFYFLLVAAALIDIITRADSQVQHLPKLIWILLVVVLPVIGSIAWFVAGRDYGPRPEYVPLGDARRHSPGSGATAVDVRHHRVSTTEQQLADLDREAEHYERLARLAKLEAEVEQRRSTAGDDVPA